MPNIYAFLPFLPALFILWVGYQNYRWVNHFGLAKRYYFLKNENLSFIFDVRQNVCMVRLVCVSLVLLSYVLASQQWLVLFQHGTNFSKVVFLSVSIAVLFLIFLRKKVNEKNLNLVLHKAQDFQETAQLRDDVRKNITNFSLSVKRTNILFYTLLLLLNVLIFYVGNEWSLKYVLVFQWFYLCLAC